MPVVLVLEDDPAVQVTLCTMLAHASFTIHLAQNVDEAIEILNTRHIDAASLDVRVPDPRGLERSGLSLLTYLRSKTTHAAVPALVFTGMPLSDAEEEAVRNMNAALFYKPQPYSVLIDHLHCALQSAPRAAS